MTTRTTREAPPGAPLPTALMGISLGCALALSCRTGQAPPPVTEPAPAVVAPVPVTSLDAGGAGPPRPVPPSPLRTLGAEVFAPGGSHLQGIFPVEGALLVVEDDKRVGRVAGESIAWIDKTFTAEQTYCGDLVLITSVQGRWPDRLDLLYTVCPGRMTMQAYAPFTGKGRAIGFGGVMTGWLRGVAYVGESALVAGWEGSVGESIQTVRGPALVRKFTTWDAAGCKHEESWHSGGTLPTPAISPSVFEGTPEGTLVSVGRLCHARAAAAEVWDKAGNARILDLGAWVKGDVYGATLLRGSGDELFLVSNPESPILAYRAGAFAPLPPLAKPARNVFVSMTGQLHASDGETIHRLEGDVWVPVARLAWPTRFASLAVDGDTFWGTRAPRHADERDSRGWRHALWASRLDAVYRLRDAPAADDREGCPTPFVYLYEVSGNNGDRYTYPETRRALSSFPDASEIELVEFREGVPRLGVVVPTRAQGQAVIAHLAAHMKDERPTLKCYAPTAPRKVEIKPKGK